MRINLCLLFGVLVMGTAAALSSCAHQSASSSAPVSVGSSSSDDVTIGQQTYSSQNRDYERPWPFGPESQ